MQGILVIAGIVLVALGGIGEWLYTAPSNIQTNTYGKSIFPYLAPNALKFIFGGLAVIFAGLFFFRGRA